MDYSIPPMTPFDTPPNVTYVPSTAFKKTTQDERSAIQVHDAATFEGQKIGAILPIRRALKATAFSSPLAQVGDFVEILAYYNFSQVEVKNLRTSMSGTIDWEDLLLVPYDGKCGCLVGGCRYVYETWQAYSARRPPRLMPVYGGQDMSGLYGMDFKLSTEEELVEVDDIYTKTYPSTVSPLQTSNYPNSPLYTTNLTTKALPEVNDPLTAAGQTPGAILAVKQHAHCHHDFGPVLETEIGDRCKFLEACEGGWGRVKVKNLRTGKEGYLRWQAFKLVNPRNTCSCLNAWCYCEYEDFEKSKAYCEAHKS
ncbi:uncharacterized protein Bfra_004493 [Botrytis fragariae]|uniref:Uncharacterized protein n=1 Tax=Botrytis fragariae TaxID=1964551 RepID=A0A8H6AVU6_9HELO|nr:uncharacterized protein Bfra_004493 [Botrytis fragariae]KAF5874483.1 hypothetical protein Bfra_004493 [Botrytis fragariae]